jgi:uncharacterized membrane protein
VRTSRVIGIIAALDSLLMAFGHATLIRAIFFSIPIGGYFLVSTLIYVLGAIFLVTRKLFKLTNFGLIVLAIIDEILLIYTRTMPNIFFHRILPWSYDLYPLGTMQILIGQAILIVLCAILYKSK